LRHNFTAYEAMYIALAEQLGMPLLTDDAKPAGSGHHADIRRYPG
jgi:predicted nucleic acid-binding protein